MPTYQYACTTPDCGNRFELVQSFTDPAASTCPVCGGPVRKVFSAVGVVFKGSGFYRNDSRTGATNGKASSSTKTSSDSSSETSSSSDKSAAATSSSTSSASSTSESTKAAAASA